MLITTTDNHFEHDESITATIFKISSIRNDNRSINCTKNFYGTIEVMVGTTNSRRKADDGENTIINSGFYINHNYNLKIYSQSQRQSLKHNIILYPSNNNSLFNIHSSIPPLRVHRTEADKSSILFPYYIILLLLYIHILSLLLYYLSILNGIASFILSSSCRSL